MSTSSLRVLVWNEGFHESTEAEVRRIYPQGIHGAIAAGLQQHLPDARIRTATFYDDELGLSTGALADTDVLLYWAHKLHADVPDDVVQRLHEAVLGGMGLVALHSAHASKIFTRLMGTTCSLAWRNDGERELVWTVKPDHPIAQGIPSPLVIPEQEMYGEHFDIPVPDDLVFISSFSGGEVFRSGVTFTRGRGRVFYFSPGDQDFPVYHHDDIRKVLANGVRWVAPTPGWELPSTRQVPPGVGAGPHRDR
jgi:trehalose utilization protein